MILIHQLLHCVLLCLNKGISYLIPKPNKDIAKGTSYSIIQQSSKVRNLGIIFDQFLSFDDYISSVCRSTHFHLRNIGRIRHLLSQNATAQLIHALISIRLDYCNSILYNLPKNSILRLQRIQNQAARILTKTPRRDHITEVLIDLHCLRIEERIVYKLLILTFKAFIDLHWLRIEERIVYKLLIYLLRLLLIVLPHCTCVN